MARKKYPSTLFVKFARHDPLQKQITSSRAHHPLDHEKGSRTFEELIAEYGVKTKNTDTIFRSLLDLKAEPLWKRKPEETCNIPNSLMFKIDSGKKGAFSCEFSRSGMLLAVASIEGSSYPIKLYQALTGERMATLEGHQDIVYQISWSSNDQLMVSVSSDGSARIWDFRSDGSVREANILQHPGFVYAGVFMPLQGDEVVVTGCYDGAIRFWNVKTKKDDANHVKKVLGHQSFINAINFESNGQKMYSGDGKGQIKIWISERTIQNIQDINFECIKTIDTSIVNYLT